MPASEFVNDVASPQLLAGFRVETGNIATSAQMVELAVVIGWHDARVGYRTGIGLAIFGLPDEFARFVIQSGDNSVSVDVTRRVKPSANDCRAGIAVVDWPTSSSVRTLPPSARRREGEKGHKVYFDKGVLMVEFNLEWLLNRKDIGSSHAAHGNKHRPA